MTSARSHSQVLECLIVVRECLTKRSLNSTALPDQARQFQRVLQRMSEARFRSFVHSDNDSGPRTVNDNLNVSLQDSDIAPSYEYVKNCTSQEWSECRMLFEEVMDGLLRGYIVSYAPRFITDPDSICACLVSTKLSI